ncbi:hypothetical protein F5Y00DRAFT_265449 [Daldinia vernicosa]|uniref:uncharacterized protein n=1 Tax=Daldinia vernicosa TaxID=114800 RepID=UPI0020084BE8|nr:uncharacterized protein F5Y00DRAFT_265449 [Daldinia vernicosa]KAI0845502.1 hypothetical protein F5Y00DRAFT_265449 [Daldinia vernicosa]
MAVNVTVTVREAFENHVKVVESPNTPGNVLSASEDSFYVADLGDVVRKWTVWIEALPDVTPFFAVKSSNDGRLIQTLASCGAGFDCASIEEIELILSMGICAERIIFTHPCKPFASLGLCRNLGVSVITFDNECELRKLKDHYPEANVVLRIFADDPTDADPLGTKFGASRHDFLRLIRLAKELGLAFAGVSFHAAPSVALDPAAYVRGIGEAAEAFTMARELGLNPTILDIGGGYTDVTFPKIAAAVRPAVEACFRGEGNRGLRIIAEPGTLFSSSPFYLAAKVIGQRKNATAIGREAPMRVYINDGIYSSFMMHFIVNTDYYPIAIIHKGTWHGQEQDTRKTSSGFECSIWGRSCDSNDCINRKCVLDRKVEIGDWLVFKDMGAYSAVCNTTFNGFTSSNHTIYLEPSFDKKATSSFKPLGI